ncbi:hypothetical protein A2U01_0066473, partial [Trifolium medium]|nr:hypothetical protein [Trifolium medium]
MGIKLKVKGKGMIPLLL